MGNPSLKSVKTFQELDLENEVNLCKSCRNVYPECTAQPNQIIFGTAIGAENIAACAKYEPFPFIRAVKFESMKFNEYQKQAKKTAVYPFYSKIIYPVLGLNGEAGEVAEKVKKIIRDNGSFTDLETRKAIAQELGDVLWYLAAIASDLDLTLEGIAEMNLDKLISRKRRKQLEGSGDNR